METKKTKSPQLTAIRRKKLSMPFRYLRQHKLLQGRILDFGCGYGTEADLLSKCGYDITGYDKYYRPEQPEGKFDTIICNYVLDVLQAEEQQEVLNMIISLLRPEGNAYFTVRRDIEEGIELDDISKRYIYKTNITLPYESIKCNEYYEIYHYHNNAEEKHTSDDCVFCNLDTNIEKISESDTCIAFYDAYPVSPGHTLIIPKRHVSSYFDLTDKERNDMNKLLILTKEVLDKRFHPDGYNIGINVNEAAGQSVFHVHLHLIPRYTGDVEQPKGGVRAVIPGKQSYGDKEHNNNVLSEQPAKRTKAYTFEQKRVEHGNAYLPWEEEADKLLIDMYVNEGKSIRVLSEIFERTEGAIHSRLVKLGIIKE